MNSTEAHGTFGMLGGVIAVAGGRAETLVRDYLVEAIKIVRGETMMLAQREHLMALWNLLDDPKPTIREEGMNSTTEVGVMTVETARALPRSTDHPYQVGKPYLIRTVTMYYIGTLIAVYPQELVLENAVWVPDTGRFFQAVTKGDLSEVEPFALGSVLIGRGSLIDASVWGFPVPTTQK